MEDAMTSMNEMIEVLKEEIDRRHVELQRTRSGETEARRALQVATLDVGRQDKELRALRDALDLMLGVVGS
jgi:hypothetical protein